MRRATALNLLAGWSRPFENWIHSGILVADQRERPPGGIPARLRCERTTGAQRSKKYSRRPAYQGVEAYFEDDETHLITQPRQHGDSSPP